MDKAREIVERGGPWFLSALGSSLLIRSELDLIYVRRRTWKLFGLNGNNGYINKLPLPQLIFLFLMLRYTALLLLVLFLRLSVY